MPLLFVVAAPLALVGMIALSLARRERERAAQARPSIDAAERIARGLSGRLDAGTVLKVSAHVAGSDVVCSIARLAPTASIRVASPVRLRPLEITLHPIGGRELADYPRADVLLATEGAPRTLWGAPDASARLPEDLRGEMARVGAHWISVEADAITFFGLPAPTSEATWPVFAARLDHAITLSASIASSDAA